MLVEDIIEDVDFFGLVGSKRSYSKVLQRKLVTGKTQALLKAIGQLGAKTPTTRLKGVQALSRLQRTDTVPLIRKTVDGLLTGKSNVT